MGPSASKNKEPKEPPPPPAFEPPKMDFDSEILTKEHLELLCKYLPMDETVRWRRVFNSGKDGKSFTRFGAQVCNRGPTIVVIRDADGHVFGGHADEGWCTYAQRYKEAQAEAAAISRASRLGQEYDKKPTYKNQHRRFFGGDRSFIFSLFPEMHVYLASGANSNFLYYDVSEIKEMSGVGMGGQPDFYGWYIDDWLDYGHCRGAPNCLTFDSPPLSKQENFYVDFVEVWQTSLEMILEEEEREGEGSPQGKKGHLMESEGIKADKMILELATDRKFYSDNL